MCSRRQSKYTRSLYIVKNTLFMEDREEPGKILDFMRSLSDQQWSQPFSKFMFWFWILFIVSSYFLWYLWCSVIMVGTIGALFYAYQFAENHNWIQDVSLCNYADQTTLDDIMRIRTDLSIRFPNPEEHDPPDADKHAWKIFWDELAKNRKEGEAELGDEEDPYEALALALHKKTQNQAGGEKLQDRAGGVGQSAGTSNLLHNVFKGLFSGDAQKSDPKGARAKSPRAAAIAKVPAPMCNKCGNVRLQGEKFKESGICAKCTPKKKKK